MGAYKRYREFGGKEQREEPQVREFRELGTANFLGIIVLCFPLEYAYSIDKPGYKFTID